jgi:hypothetical protein
MGVSDGISTLTEGLAKDPNPGVADVSRKSLHVMSRLEELEFDPIENLVDICNDPNNIDNTLKARINMELLSYVAPKRRAVDEKGETEDKGIHITIMKFSGGQNVINQRFTTEAVSEAQRALETVPKQIYGENSQ